MTDTTETLSIVVPVYDEEQNLAPLTGKLLDTLQDLGRDFEIVFINDGSADGSADILDELAAGDARIRVVHFKRNFGQTSAMMAGLDFASGDIIIPIDADLQNDPADIPLLIETMRSANVDFVQEHFVGALHLEIIRLDGAGHFLPWNEKRALWDAVQRAIRASDASVFAQLEPEIPED